MSSRTSTPPIRTPPPSPTSSARFESAKSLLNFGFANYTLVDVRPGQALPPIDVRLGRTAQVQPQLPAACRLLVQKDQVNSVATELHLAPDVEAPVEKGQTLGQMIVRVAGEERESIPIVAGEAVERITVPGIFYSFLRQLFMAS